MYAWLVLLFLLIILSISVWQRIKYFREILAEKKGKVSPLSLAIQDLVAIAGSIYLSLVMLVSFLKLTIPNTMIIFDISIDPLAFLAIGLAIIQPLFLNLWKGITKKG